MTTIDCQNHIVEVSNLFESNEILNLCRRGKSVMDLAAVSFVSKRNLQGEEWSTVMRRAVDEALAYKNKLLGGLDWFFFGANDTWQRNSAVVRHKRFWKANNSLSESGLLNSSREFEFLNSDGNLRYAVCAVLTGEVLPLFCDWVRHTQSGFIFLQNKNKIHLNEIVSLLYDVAYHNNETTVDWARLAQELCSDGSLIVRCSGSFDDPDAAVDFIYNPEKNCLFDDRRKLDSD